MTMCYFYVKREIYVLVSTSLSACSAAGLSSHTCNYYPFVTTSNKRATIYRFCYVAHRVLNSLNILLIPHRNSTSRYYHPVFPDEESEP